MGAWGTGIFENDGALDSITILKQEWLSLLKTKLEAGLAVDYLEVDQAHDLIVVLEAIAAACGRPSIKLPDDFPVFKLSVGWSQSIEPLISRSLARIRDDSELSDLWREGEGPEFNDWLAVLADLEQRLKG